MQAAADKSTRWWLSGLFTWSVHVHPHTYIQIHEKAHTSEARVDVHQERQLTRPSHTSHILCLRVPFNMCVNFVQLQYNRVKSRKQTVGHDSREDGSNS
jgi:hypothetical protein